MFLLVAIGNCVNFPVISTSERHNPDRYSSWFAIASQERKMLLTRTHQEHFSSQDETAAR
ncbi:MAG TPA: hypothetical protein V6D50_00655 [Chroococcales cyanobacterium]